MRVAPAVLTAFGVVAAAVMVVSYAIEKRDRRWIAVFAMACVATAVYAIATNSWLFAVLEFIWAAIAVRRLQAISSPRAQQTGAFSSG